MSNMFNNCISLTTIPSLDTSSVIDMEEAFGGCSSLTSAPDLNLSKSNTTMGYFFPSCTKLTTLTDNTYAPAGQRWQFKYNADFGDCPLNKTSILKVFNGLQTVTGKTITISSTTNGYLSDSDKSIATSKGWTIKVR